MNTYETIYISPADLAQEKIEAGLEKVRTVITRAEGKIISAELWGRRKLSYPIKRNRDGYYVYLVFSAPSQMPSLLDRHFRLTETILRGLTVKVDPRHLEKMRAPARPPASAPAASPPAGPAPAANPSEPAPATAETESAPAQTESAAQSQQQEKI